MKVSLVLSITLLLCAYGRDAREPTQSKSRLRTRKLKKTDEAESNTTESKRKLEEESVTTKEIIADHNIISADTTMPIISPFNTVISLATQPGELIEQFRAIFIQPITRGFHELGFGPDMLFMPVLSEMHVNDIFPPLRGLVATGVTFLESIGDKKLLPSLQPAVQKAADAVTASTD